jgi:hypothetical protein
MLAVHLLGKYKCQQCIDTLIDLMNNDHIFDVRELAYEKLIRFGLDVGPQLKTFTSHGSSDNAKNSIGRFFL